MYGNCVECGFPISLKESNTIMACPFCSTINRISESVSLPTIVLGVIITGILLLATSKVR
jgi:hypothetical protein